MLEFFRQTAALIILSPFVVVSYLLIIFLGRSRAIKIMSGPVTAFSKLAVRLLLPNVDNHDEFDKFVAKFTKSSKIWKIMYNFTWSAPDENTLKLHITNCPFCQLLPKIGLSDLNTHVCRGDWEYAKVCSHKWDFEREHQIGSGDKFCDHTYKRKFLKGQDMSL